MKNHLYYGDNLTMLRKFVKDESVDLCYIDPPFNSKRNYNQIYNNLGKEDTAQAQAFTDTWTWDIGAEEGFADIMDNLDRFYTYQTIQAIALFEKILGKNPLTAYLISMTQRIAQIHRTLKITGSFYLHCDPTASHYLKIVCDSIFCPNGGDFLNEIVWKRTTAHSDSGKCGNSHDIVLFYSKGDKFKFNKLYQKYDPEYIDSHYRRVDDKGRRWTDGDLTAKGLSGGGYTYEYKGCKSLWRCPIETMERLDLEGKLHFTSNGGIRLKRYLDEMPGMPLQDIWTDIPPLNSQAKERLGYPTQKPEALLERIIKASSDEGDVVLDAYCGCGTTVAVAGRTNRRWIGIDITYQAISLILKRLEESQGLDAVKHVYVGGVPHDLAAAEALAHRRDDRTRKEFEKWAVLTYSNNLAMINEKKGGDRGIDGIAFTADYDTRKNISQKEVIFSVKSNKSLSPSVIRDLYGTIEREKAAMGYLLTLYPMDNLVKESKQYGFYENSINGRKYSRIEVVSVKEILEGKRLDLPMAARVLKQADSKFTGYNQTRLF